MFLLRLLWLAAFLILAVITITQIVLPTIKSGKLFPAFRSNDLRDRVEATRETVETLRDQNKNLSELEILLKQKADLEEKISKVEKPNQGKE